MADSESINISIADWPRIQATVLDYEARKAKGQGVTSTSQRIQGAPIATGWIYLNSGTVLGANRWKYSVDVYPTPFAKLLSTQIAAIATSQVGFNGNEVGNTSSSIYGQTIPGSPTCGDLIGIEPAHTNYKGPILAQCYWTYFESNNPSNGYPAWWFNVSNFGKYQPKT